jgi:hypothetical protein
MGRVRWDKGEWLLNDPDGKLDEVYMWETEARRWSWAGWCSVQTGKRIRGGALTMAALFAEVVTITFVPTFMLAVAAGLYAIMRFGAWVLPQ